MMKKTVFAFTLSCLLASPAFSHGYITEPASRAANCKTGKNPAHMCGTVQWEPQSIEALSGYPEGYYPPDGQLASGGIERFLPLDVPRDNWHQMTVKPGTTMFTWKITAAHKTRNWRYYITRPDWHPGESLTRASFETKPFCFYDGKNQIPPQSVTHQCNIPERKGAQIIYGVWEIADTANSFYQVIDVRFD
ncbi:TPA: lytic polysaccharide monooxygenase [Morganella morganii]|uniref:lytic polysaccharide monooxygenase n=1 Tax=Morganella morganii TaxID=582 RepID=UPI00229622D7|nr:lytic polysaccharide monooxygenase [Morganella morganii]